MKAFEFYRNCNFLYPDEMEKILEYLNSHGKINVSDKMVESLYEDFSTEVYCAGWMGVSDELLSEFAEWLSDCDI